MKNGIENPHQEPSHEKFVAALEVAQDTASALPRQGARAEIGMDGRAMPRKISHTTNPTTHCWLEKEFVAGPEQESAQILPREPQADLCASLAEIDATLRRLSLVLRQLIAMQDLHNSKPNPPTFGKD